MNEKMYTDYHGEQSFSKNEIRVFHFKSWIGSRKHNILGIETIISKENKSIFSVSQVFSVTRT